MNYRIRESFNMKYEQWMFRYHLRIDLGPNRTFFRAFFTRRSPITIHANLCPVRIGSDGRSALL